MGGITCTLECGHEIGWGDTPETPGADLPWVGRMAWCHDCEGDQEIEQIQGLECVTADKRAEVVRLVQVERPDLTTRDVEEYLDADWPEGREHIAWLTTAPEQEIADWVVCGNRGIYPHDEADA